MTRSLVTGASGFIGSHIAEALFARGDEVVCLVRKGSDPKWLINSKVRRFEADYSAPASIVPAIDGVDFIYHCAGVTKAYSRDEYLSGNLGATKALFKAILESGSKPKRVVALSSLAATGPSLDGKPLQEDAEPHPVTWYGESKLLAEREAMSFADKFPVTVVRPPIVFGPRDTDLFQYFWSIRKLGLKLVLKGDRKYSVIFVSDLVAGCLAAGASPAAEGMAYFISDPRLYGWGEIGDAIEEACGNYAAQFRISAGLLGVFAKVNESMCRMVGRRTIFNSQKALEIAQPNWVCDPSRSAKDFGFIAGHKLGDAMKITFGWYRENRWL